MKPLSTNDQYQTENNIMSNGESLRYKKLAESQGTIPTVNIDSFLKEASEFSPETLLGKLQNL